MTADKIGKFIWPGGKDGNGGYGTKNHYSNATTVSTAAIATPMRMLCWSSTP